MKKEKMMHSSTKTKKRITGLDAKMWGNSIIGFGAYHYKYESGREGDFFSAGFSPRKTSTTFYVISGFPEYEQILETLGNYKLGKSCLYINNLEKIDQDIPELIISKSLDEMVKKYPE